MKVLKLSIFDGVLQNAVSFEDIVYDVYKS